MSKNWAIWRVRTSFQFPWFRRALEGYWFFEVVLFHKCYNWSRHNGFLKTVEELRKFPLEEE